MNNQQLFQIVQAAGGMHLLYNNDIEQVRAIAQAAFEAGKQDAGSAERYRIDDLEKQLRRAERALRSAGWAYTEGAAEWQPQVVPSASPLLDMSDSRNWQVGDVVQLICPQYAGFGVGQYGTVHAAEDDGMVRIVLRRQCDAMPMPLPLRHECASIDFKWIKHATKETAK